MIKLFTFRKIAISTLLLLVAFLLYNYPEELNEDVTIKDNTMINIYLVDFNGYVAMTKVASSLNFEDALYTIIDSLTIGNDNLPDGFSGVLPENTKLLSYSLDGDLLKVNFSKELLNVCIDTEEDMMESLVYSLTLLENVDKVMIFVEGDKLNELPNSHRRLNLYLDRNYGINKIVDISTLNSTKMVTVYYLDNSDSYYIPVSYVVNDTQDKIQIIVNSLKTNKFNSSNLSSHLDYQVELMNYEATEEEFLLNFNDSLLDSIYDGELKEEVKYALSYSIYDTFGIESVVFEVNSNKIDEFVLAK